MTEIRIPTLRTDRLVLRAPGPADFEAYAGFYASDRAATVGGPLDRLDAWRSLAGVIGHWVMRGYGRWVVEDRATGTALGVIGLHYPEGWPEPEIGWLVYDGAEGRSVAHEAALAARTHAYDTLGWRTAISLIMSGNARSEALATRLGARFERAYEHAKYGPMRIWRHPDPDTLEPESI